MRIIPLIHLLSPIIPPKTSANSEGLKPTQRVKVYSYNPYRLIKTSVNRLLTEEKSD